MALTAHGYTETTIVTAFRATVGDAASNAAQRWSGVECIDFINRGAGQLVLDIPNSLETYWEIDSVSGTREYEMPPDFIAHKRVEYRVDSDDHRVLKYMNESQWRDAGFPLDKTNTGEPEWFTYLRALGETAPNSEQPRYIALEPTPDTSSLKIRIYGYKLMQPLADGGSDVPELMTPKLEAVLYYAAHLAMLDDENDARARMFLGLYENQVTKIRSFMIDEAAGFDDCPRLRPFGYDASRGGGPPMPWSGRVG
jgi:hypothetical protein